MPTIGVVTRGKMELFNKIENGLKFKDLDGKELSISSRNYYDAIINNSIELLDTTLFTTSNYDEYCKETIIRIVQSDVLVNNLDKYIYNYYYRYIKQYRSEFMIDNIKDMLFPYVEGLEASYNENMNKLVDMSDKYGISVCINCMKSLSDNAMSNSPYGEGVSPNTIKLYVDNIIRYSDNTIDYSPIGGGKVICTDKYIEDNKIKASYHLQNALNWDIVIVAHGYSKNGIWRIDKINYHDNTYNKLYNLLQAISIIDKPKRVLLLVCNDDGKKVELFDKGITINYPTTGLLSEIDTIYKL